MRLTLFFTFFIASCSLLGQSVQLKTLKLKNGELKSASISDTAKAKRLILAFADDEGERWKYTSWTQELHWLAISRNAIVVTPQTNGRVLTWLEIEALMKSYKDSVQSLDNTEFIALGSGAQFACEMVVKGYSGLFIAPSEMAKFPINDESAATVGIVSTRSDDVSADLIDSLKHHGHWMLTENQFQSDYYYLDGYKSLYASMFEKIDSVKQTLTKDSGKKTTSILNQLPEVVRQGDVVEIKMMVFENGTYLLDLYDLSAKSVMHQELYLGKGENTFLLKTENLDWGVYKVQLDGPKFLYKHKLMIRG